MNKVTLMDIVEKQRLEAQISKEKLVNFKKSMEAMKSHQIFPEYIDFNLDCYTSTKYADLERRLDQIK